MLSDGLYLEHTSRVKCIICDAPVNNFVKGTKQFNYKHECDTCLILGTFIKGSNVNL